MDKVKTFYGYGFCYFKEVDNDEKSDSDEEAFEDMDTAFSELELSSSSPSHLAQITSPTSDFAPSGVASCCSHNRKESEELTAKFKTQIERVSVIFGALPYIPENGIINTIVFYDQNLQDYIIKTLEQGNRIFKNVERIARAMTTLDLNSYPERIENITQILAIFKNVKALTTPRFLTGSCNITLAQLENLESLDLTFSNITDDFLASITCFDTLNSLDLTWSKEITDRGISVLKNFTALRTLNLSWCVQITDNGLAWIAHIKTLEVLDLFYCNEITDNGLALLVSLPILESLVLSGCTKITDDGLIKLAKFEKLRKLCVSYCGNITTAGIAKAKKINPLLEIYRFS